MKRRGHAAERAAAERQRDRAGALAGGQRHDRRAQAAGKRHAFAETEEGAAQRKPHQPGHPSVRHAGDRPDRDAHQHADAQADVIENGAPERIRDRVGDEEIRVDDRELPALEPGVPEDRRARARPAPDGRQTRATSTAPCRSTAPRLSNRSRLRARSLAANCRRRGLGTGGMLARPRGRLRRPSWLMGLVGWSSGWGWWAGVELVGQVG